MNQQQLNSVSRMGRPTNNILTNFGLGVERLGTGINTIFARGVKENLADLGNYIASNTAGDIGEDFANAMLSPYYLDVNRLQTGSPVENVARTVQGVYDNPFEASLDAISLGAGSALGKAANAVNKAAGVRVLPSATSTAIEGALNSARQSSARGLSNLEKTLKDFRVEGFDITKPTSGTRPVTNKELAQVIQAAEEGTELPKYLKPVLKKVRQFGEEYHELVKTHAPKQVVEPKETAIFQNIVRNSSMTYDEVKKALTPYMDKPLEEAIKAIPDKELAARLKNASDLYDKGRIFPVTHSLAGGGELAGTLDTADRMFAGRFSDRMLGQASYDDIANVLMEGRGLVETLATRFTENQLAKNILEGIVDKSIVGSAKEGAKNVTHLSKKLLEEGDLRGAISNASKTASKNTIAVENHVIDDILGQMAAPNDLAGALKDIHNVGKGSLLSSGLYLGANATTGIGNTLLNSGINVLGDIASAAKTKGALSEALGITRRSILPEVSTPGLKQINRFNQITGRPLNVIDTKLQNMFSEIAANAELRKMGIKPAERVGAIEKLDPQTIGNLITDIKATSLANSTNTVLPRNVVSALAPINPFWRWGDRAASSSYHMMKKNPIAANVVLTDILANIGFDKEMQNRARLNAEPNMPYLHYKMDQNGRLVGDTVEYVPLTTTLKMLSPGPGGRGKMGAPVISDLMNVAAGKDRYGRPLKRASKPDELVGATATYRYKVQPDGSYQKLGMQNDEMVATAVRLLFGAPNLANQFAGPVAARFVGGPDASFAQPYAQSVFGEMAVPWETIQQADLDNNILMGGNAASVRDISDVGRRLSGGYTMNYYDPNRPLSKTVQKQLLRDMLRKRQYGGY